MKHIRNWGRAGLALVGMGVIGAGIYGLKAQAQGQPAAAPAAAAAPLTSLVSYTGGSPTLITAADSGNLNIPTAGSSNWTGVTTTNITAKEVQASYAAPAWQGGAYPGQSVGDWVGLGGAQSRQLIQVGTVTTANREGQPVTRAFWEELPASARLGPVVPAGTPLTASITPLGGDSWRLELTSPGRSTPWVDQVVHLSPGQSRAVESSADVITEAITRNHHLVPLAPFGQTAFTGIRFDGVPLGRMPEADLAASVIVGPGGAARAAAYYSPSAPDTMTVKEAGGGQGFGYGGGYGYTIPRGYGYGYGLPGGGGYGIPGGYGYGYAIPGGYAVIWGD